MPENKKIEQYLTRFFVSKDDISSYTPTFKAELLRTGDEKLLEYVYSLHPADMYIIPLVQDLSGVKYLSLHIYKDGEFKTIFEAVDNKNLSFEPEVLLKLAPYFTDTKYSLVKLEDFVSGTYVQVDGKKVTMVDNCLLIAEGEHNIQFSSVGYTSENRNVNLEADTINPMSVILQMPVYHNIEIESFPAAEVLIDGEFVGNTPLVIDEYSIPLTLRLQAEGYSDRVISVTEPRNKISVNLRTVSMEQIDLFKKTQNKFYWSFTRTLLLFGAMAGTRASERFTKSAQKGINYGFYGAIGLSLVDMGFKLYKYFNGIKNIVP